MPHHLTFLQHPPFQPKRHQHLYISLESLPPSTPALAFSPDLNTFRNRNGFPIPLFIAGPMMILFEGNMYPSWYYATHTFLTEISIEPRSDPTPMHPACEVCKSVRWLLRHCTSYRQCKQHFQGTSQGFVFEVLREICTRIRPKLLSFSRETTALLDSIELIQVQENPPYLLNIRQLLPKKPEHVSELTFAELQLINIMIVFIHRDYLAGSPRSIIGGFVLTNFIHIFRLIMIRLQPNLRRSSPIDPVYSLPGTWNKPLVVIEMLRLLATALSHSLIELDMNRIMMAAEAGNTPLEDAIARQFLYERKLVQAMENLMAMNMPEVFDRLKTLSQKLNHWPDCPRNSRNCLCYVASQISGMDCSRR
ncbi:hypothetical protein ECG_09493 [Echinococcus granulosus]|uniref:Uncharacterized protein n=1 Tax=Echinococcus granulosus TaxID=6210 RepID=U6J9H0_ECHGR|nr:hypothetical protein EGR_07608 [Echinococcus granulosus]EUB57517.1 hypothetical protein EGR_07608 [Echinococcus granulosus]KAH9277657.1 hypothetical protein ECG_09493 [Echinococcus granulosus]CDS20699.1 hypothetical protein EgrG_001139700 [Echinococcus granulosus]